MADWIDYLGDAIFRTAEFFMNSERPKRSLGILFVALTVFGAVAILAAIAWGANVALAGYYVVVPLLLTTASIAGYCFLTDRSQ